MTFAALPTLQKNSLSTTTTSNMTTSSPEVEVAEQAVFYRDGVLLTHGWELGPDNAVEFRTEEVIVTSTDGVSGAGTVFFSTRAIKADGTNGAAYAWPAGTRIRNTLSTSVYDQIKDNFAAHETNKAPLASPTFTGTLTAPTIDLTGGKIKFPAAISASSDANTLDDYEEGTFTPAITFGGGSVGVTYTSQSGKYTKIGNVVTVIAAIVLSSKGTSTGILHVVGLPFTIAASVYPTPGVWVYLISSTGMIMAYGAQNSTHVVFTSVNTTGEGMTMVDTNLSATSQITFSMTYVV